MTAITQKIHNYIGGISQQPDEAKIPGQVVEAQNVLPDAVQGLQKRFGSELVNALSSETNGKWFHYYRDEDEQYIGQIDRTGGIKVWKCSDGSEITVTKKSGEESDLTAYLVHTLDEDLQTLTLNDFTYITNRTKTTAMAADIATAKPSEAFIELKKVAYASQYSVNLFDDVTTTSISTATKLSVVQTQVGNDSMCPNVGTKIISTTAGVRQRWQITGITSGTDHTADFLDTNTSQTYTLTYDNPSGSDITLTNVNATGSLNKIVEGWKGNEAYDELPFEIIYIGAATLHLLFKDPGANAIVPASHTVLLNSGTLTIGGASSVTADGTLANHTTGNTTDSTTKKDLYFRLTTTGQSVPSDAGPSDVTYTCRYTTIIDLLHGGEGWAVNDEIVVPMNGGIYTITVDEISTSQVQANLGLIRPTPTSFDGETTVTSENILGALRTDIIAANSTWDAWPSSGETASTVGVKQIGNGIYIRRDVSDVFSISTPASDLLNVFTDAIDDVAQLPTQCRHNYVVKVRNSAAEEDDYYLKFEGDNGLDGPGSWTECPEPGRKITFNPATMPVQLVRQADGTFELSKVTWQNCLVGDTTTVPEPSFIGKTINKMLFWRNRLVLLSDENVIMSQPGEFFNFWPKSAITYTATDVIDISCSSPFPAIVYDGVQTNSGLLLFTKNQQLLLTTDSDILSPVTAKINTLSTYNFNFKTNPISLGTTVAFLDNAGKYSRFWEMGSIQRDTEPIVTDQTKVISTLFDKDMTIISASRENGIIVFSTKNSNTLYILKYFNTGEKRIQQSWFTWKFNGKIQHHAILDDSLYLITRDTSDVMQRIPLKLNADTHIVTDDRDTSDVSDDFIYRIYLDNASKITVPTDAYDESTDITSLTLSSYPGYQSLTAKYGMYLNTGDNEGDYSEGSYNIAKATIDFSGDFSGEEVVLGYLFDMEIQFPTIFRSNTSDNRTITDTHASLTIHRVKFNLGNVGSYTTIIDKVGKNTYTDTWEAAKYDAYTFNSVNIANQYTQTIPIYEKNKNVTIKLKSTSPAPATLHSMSWEGSSTNKFYQRV